MADVTDFQSSPIWPEVEDILNSGRKKVLFDFKATVHTEKEDFKVFDLNAYEYTRDYLSNIGETAKITFKLGLGDYVNRLFPYRQNLELTIKRTPLDEGGSDRLIDDPILVTRYKAIFNPSQNPPVGGSELESIDIESLNVSDIVEIHLELVDRSLEPLRIKTTGGAYSKVTAEAVIRGLIGGESLKVLVDGKPSIDRLDIVPLDNKETINHIVIQHGMHMTAVPTFLQESVGIYNRGVGTYFQSYEGKKTWFVYPTYDIERFDGSDKKMIFYAVPQEKLPQLDRSFRKEGDVVKVAITAQRRYTDSAELGQMNEGSGFRMADARSYMAKPVKVTEDGPKAVRNRLNHEVTTKDRTDGLNYAPVVKNTSSNPFTQRSSVTARSLGQLDIVWENSDASLIYPGMPCKYIYLSQGKAISLKGTILFVHTFIARVEKNNASAFRSTSRISISCEPQTKRPDLPVKDTNGEE